MALPSQSARSLGFGQTASTYRRKKRRFNPALVTMLMVVVGVVVAAVWGGSALLSGPSKAGANEGAVPPEGGSKPAGWGVAPADKVERSEPVKPEAGRDPPREEPRDEASRTPEQPAERAQGPEAPGAADVERLIGLGQARFKAGDLVEARVHFNRALQHPRATEGDRASIRRALMQINEELVFSPKVTAGDPFTELYTIQANDSLVKIASRQGLAVDHRFIARVNRMSNPNKIGLGNKLKLVRGPFHAVVSKSAFRLDLYVADPSDPEDPSRRVYIRSFDVGLGEGDSTPLGDFLVKADSKLIDPPWVNPRTGQAFAADDPKNPIGEHWLGLSGLGDAQTLSGYGIHGTIEPESIGTMRSMGCIRLRPEDVAIVYEMLEERVSTVTIGP